MKDQELHALIQEYLHGTLPLEQRVQLESRMASEPDVAALYQECKLAYETIRLARDESLRDKMKDWDKEL